jgi:radical SAM superfamily enzyme YgiQ (UPF0313 family)
MVMFDDSTFGLYPHLPALLTELGRTGMKFGCLNRFDHLVRADLLDAYRNAGFDYFYCAVEQFDDPVLKQMTKAENTARMQASIRQLHEHGFVLGVSLLYGLPYETRESVEQTLDFVGRWVDAGTIRLVSQSVLSFHPGTPAGRHLDKGFDTTPPNQGFPFDQFEEGLWYHPPHVNAHGLEWIVDESTKRFGQYLVRNRDVRTAAQSAGTSGPAAGMASCKIV